MNEQDDTTYQPIVVGAPVVEEPTPEPTPVVAEEPTPAPIEEPTPDPVVEPEPVAVAQPEPVAAPEPVVVATPQAMPKPQPTRHVVTNGDADPVYLKQCVYENKFNRKSLTVHHVQRRLVDLGYNDAVGDKDGWYSELTLMAVKAFQKDNRLESTGLMDEATFAKLFDGDTNVEIVLS